GAGLGGGAIGQRLQLVREAFHLLVTSRHFLVGGSSPVSVRQILEAARREATVAIAPVAPYRADQSSLRSMERSCPGVSARKPVHIMLGLCNRRASSRRRTASG